MSAQIWGLTDPYIKKFCVHVVTAFLELPEAQPIGATSDTFYPIGDIRDYFSTEVLPTRQTWKAQMNFGGGPICLSFDWTGEKPFFEVSLHWLRGKDCDPADSDEPFKVWQKLLSKLETHGYVREWLKLIITFKRSI